MTEEQYKKICEACDNVLLLPDSTIERVAIPWLHVIREHPIFLVNYQGLFEVKSRLNLLIDNFLHNFRNLIVLLRGLLRALHSGGKSWFGRQHFPQNADIVILSHLLNASQVGESSDFYFGDLPNELAEKGYSVVIALINHTGKKATFLTSQWDDNDPYRVIFSNSLNILQEVSIWWRLRKESSRLSQRAKIEVDSFLRKIFFRASQEALSSATSSNLRLGYQIEKLVARTKPAILVVTYEGHGWERLAFSFARSAITDVRCIGYQHAALFRLQHAVRRNLSHGYNPDLIMSGGVLGKERLEHSLGLNGTKISVLGSTRTFKRLVHNSDSLTSLVMAQRTINPICLVLPEGDVTECQLLFNFSLECAEITPKIKYIWRLHPLINFESLIERNPKFANLPSNIFLSSTTLDDDIVQSRWVLYRGTTAVIAAVMAGLRPIYLQLTGEMTIDPLYELEKWKAKITSASDFKLTIQSDIDCSYDLLYEDIELAQEYCDKFFRPIDVNSLINLLPNHCVR